MKYVVEIEGTVTLDGEDELTAEDTALDFLHGGRDSFYFDPRQNIDVNINVLDVKEI